MHETKVNTENAGYTSSDAKNLIPSAVEYVGTIETPYGIQQIERGSAADHAYMRSRQLTSLLLLIQGEGSERFCTLGPGTRDSLLWMAVQLSEELEAMVDILAVDLVGHKP